MARKKFDGLVVAVRYTDSGRIMWVRLYERRGATFSDLVHLARDEIIGRINEGQKFVTGKRIPQMASTFEVHQPLELLQINGREFLVAGEHTAKADYLEGVPVI